jgi:hypothetical protein
MRPLTLALGILLPAAAVAAAAEFPSIVEVLTAARFAAREGPPAVAVRMPPRGSPDDLLAAQVAARLGEIAKLKPVEWACAGGMPMCPGDRRYFEKASVDAAVSGALQTVLPRIKASDYRAAAKIIRGIRNATLYEGAKLIPRGVVLYLAMDVEAKVASAESLLP